jgi:hypothetical protein
LNFYFFSFNSPFYLVRAAALRTAVARATGVTCSAIFESSRFPVDPIFVCNRFVSGKIFNDCISTMQRTGVPYVMDIDDAYWDLPSHSTDAASDLSTGTRVIQQTDRIVRAARCITTTTPYLAAELARRFSGATIIVVPNCVSPELVHPGGVCIANTDSFKAAGALLTTLRSEFRNLAEQGVPVTFFGENENFFTGSEDFIFSALPRQSYEEYLSRLSTGQFRYGAIPVQETSYARCKSEIKALEFLGAGMTVFGSDIEPYRALRSTFQGDSLHLVPNTPEGWKGCTSTIQNSLDPETLQRNRAVLQQQRESRKAQLVAWKEVGALMRPLLQTREGAVGVRALQKRLRFAQRLQGLLQSARRLIQG